MEENRYCVYKHTNKINGKVYIGQTGRNPESRWLEGKGYIGCTLFYNAIQKYGWDAFDHEIVYDCLSFEEANKYEKELIESYDSTNPEKGYNLMSGGVKSQPCEATRQKMKEAHSGEKNHFYGKTHTPEVKERLRQKNLGKTIPAEVREKISRSIKVTKSKNKKEQPIKEKKDGRKRHRTEEEKINISMKLKNRTFSEETRNKISQALSKPVLCIETGIVYYGISEAARQMGFGHTTLVRHLKGGQKTFAGYHWKYLEKDDDDNNDDDNEVQSDIRPAVVK